jgi:hypothetical protein
VPEVVAPPAEAVAPAPAILPAPPAPPAPPALPALRVELGFRDGTTAVLDPGSQQAQALQDLSRLLRSSDRA